MRYQLKSVRTWSAVKVTFFMSLVMGFVIGLLYALFLGPLLLLGDGFGGGFSNEGAVAGVVLVFMPFGMAFFSALVNTILVVIATPLYNLLGRVVGGLEFDIEAVQSPNEVYSTPPPISRPGTSGLAPAPPPPPPVASPQPSVAPQRDLDEPHAAADDAEVDSDDTNDNREDDRPTQL